MDAAESGEVVYLTRNGARIAAVVPPEVAAAGWAAVVALEDAADLVDARAALVEEGESVPAERLWRSLVCEPAKPAGVQASCRTADRKLPCDAQKAIKDTTEAPRADPRPHGVVELSGSDDCGASEFGRYRVVYQIVDDELVVAVVKAGLRDESTYRKKR